MKGIETALYCDQSILITVFRKEWGAMTTLMPFLGLGTFLIHEVIDRITDRRALDKSFYDLEECFS